MENAAHEDPVHDSASWNSSTSFVIESCLVNVSGPAFFGRDFVPDTLIFVMPLSSSPDGFVPACLLDTGALGAWFSVGAPFPSGASFTEVIVRFVFVRVSDPVLLREGIEKRRTRLWPGTMAAI